MAYFLEDARHMIYFELVCMHLIELLFFVGLTGCFGVVLLSWISIFKSGFAAEREFRG